MSNLAGCIELAIAVKIEENLNTRSKSTPSTTVFWVCLCYTYRSPYFAISQLAVGANVPTSTVRYYERRRLLEPTTRSSGNNRMYDCETLERLLFIRSAQHAGFTLSDSSSLLEFRDGDGVGHLKRPFKFQFTNA